MFSTSLIQPVLAFGGDSSDLIWLLPIIIAIVITQVFMRFPKTGIALSLLLCLFSVLVGGIIGNSSGGFVGILIMAHMGISGMVGIVACVIQRNINKLSEKSEE